MKKIKFILGVSAFALSLAVGTLNVNSFDSENSFDLSSFKVLPQAQAEYTHGSHHKALLRNCCKDGGSGCSAPRHC